MMGADRKVFMQGIDDGHIAQGAARGTDRLNAEAHDVMEIHDIGPQVGQKAFEMRHQGIGVVQAQVEPVIVVGPEQRFVRRLSQRHQGRRAVPCDRGADACHVMCVPSRLLLHALEQVIGCDLRPAD